MEEFYQSWKKLHERNKKNQCDAEEGQDDDLEEEDDEEEVRPNCTCFYRHTEAQILGSQNWETMKGLSIWLKLF